MRRLLAVDRKSVVSASFHLTSLETYILGAILAAAMGVQLNISMSVHAHDALTALILIVGAVVQPISKAQFTAKLPPGLITIVQALLGAVVLLSQSWSLGATWLTVIGVVIVIANTLGLGPTAPISKPPAAQPAGPQQSVRTVFGRG